MSTSGKKLRRFLAAAALAAVAVLAVRNVSCAADKGFAKPDSVISVQDIQELKGAVLVDCSQKARELIPGAIYIDRDDLFRTVNGIKLMLPAQEAYEKVLGKYGITENATVVTYSDTNNIFATRFYWDLKILGHKDVRVLDGGITAWKAAGYPTVRKPAASAPAARYASNGYDLTTCADLELVNAATRDAGYVIIDTRSEKEYKAGKIPGAVNIEWSNAVNADMTFKTATELKEVYKGISPDKVIIAHCLGGIRASHTWFVLSELLGYPNVKNYDGSWWEYEKSGMPIEK